MQLPHELAPALQYLDIGGRGVIALLLTVLVMQVRQVKNDLSTVKTDLTKRVERLEGQKMNGVDRSHHRAAHSGA